MIRNVDGQVVSAQMIIASTGAAHTTAASVSVNITIDGGTQTLGGGTIQHEGGGCWSYFPSVAETNGDHISYTFSATGAIPVTVQVYTSKGTDILPNRRNA